MLVILTLSVNLFSVQACNFLLFLIKSQWFFSSQEVFIDIFVTSINTVNTCKYVYCKLLLEKVLNYIAAVYTATELIFPTTHILIYIFRHSSATVWTAMNHKMSKFHDLKYYTITHGNTNCWDVSQDAGLMYQ